MAVFAYLCGVLVALVVGLGAAQECYYPNGNLAPSVEKPCSSAPGSACCPEKWVCMDNGLCHYEPENLYGRYSCTDQGWKSPGCPANMCTYDMTATGGESITQCAAHDDNWCCNGDGASVECCAGVPVARPFFALQAPEIYGTAGGKTGSSVPTLASITGKALEGSVPATVSSRSSMATALTMRTSAVASKDSSGSSSPSLSPTLTPSHTSLPGPTSTSSTPPPSASPPPNPPHTPHLPLILALSLSIPLFLALVTIIIWLLRKRKHMKAHPFDYSPHTNNTNNNNNTPHFSSAPPYPGLSFAAEEKQLHVHGEAATEPVSTIPGKAELDSGEVVEGVPYCADSVGAGIRKLPLPLPLPIASSMDGPRRSEGGEAVAPFSVLGGEVVSGRSTPVHVPQMSSHSLTGRSTPSFTTGTPFANLPGRYLTTGAADGWIPSANAGHASLAGRPLDNVPEVAELSAERSPNATPTQGRNGATPLPLPGGIVELGVGRGSPV